MTELNMLASQESNSFDERIEMLSGELQLAVKWQRPCVLFVVYGSEYVRAEVEAALENCLIDLGQKRSHFTVRDQDTRDIISFLREFKNPERTVFFINGLRWGHGEETSVYTMLNLQKEFFVEKRVRAIFWLTRNEIVDLAHHAPGFWVFRHRAIEFVESPKAQRVLQEAMDSAWQGTGEYEDEYEDTDAKISLRESMLAELPKGEEASSTRANLLLTLGILNWRKGDFEKADEQLKEALKIAAKIQDGWFEAECFNAIALLKTSMERMDEAIEAYKHAIQLAPDQIFTWNNLGNLCARIDRNDEAIIAFQKAVECNPKDPVGWNGLGNVYHKIGYIDDAIAAYRKSIQFMPTFAQPWNGLGNVYAGSGRVDEAQDAYNKAIALNSKYVTPWIQSARLYSKGDRYREAVKAYRRALGMDSKNSAVWNELGMLQSEHEAYEEAEEAFQKAIALDRGNGWAYSNLGHSYIRQGRCKESVSLFLRSIELLQDDKDKTASWNRLGDAYRQLNDYDNAIAAYQAADKLETESAAQTGHDTVSEPGLTPSAPESDPIARPEPGKGINNLPRPAPEAKTGQPLESRVAPSMPRVEQVFADTPYWLFNPLAEMESPETPDEGQPKGFRDEEASQSAKGAAMPNSSLPGAPEKRRAKKPEDMEALKMLEQTGEESTNALVWNETGNAHFKRGAIEEAINAYNKAIQFDTEFGWPYSNLALAYITQGQYTEAILLYQRSIELLDSDKDKAVSWNGLGNVYRRIHDYANAVAAYQKAAELDPETAGMREGLDSSEAGQDPRNAQAWNDLGEVFFKTGAYDEAARAFEKAIGLVPEFGWAHSNLARTLSAQGKHAEAVPLFRKSIELFQEDKDKAVSWNRLGNVYRKLNDYDHAIQAYQQAVALAEEDAALITRTRFSLLSNLAAD